LLIGLVDCWLRGCQRPLQHSCRSLNGSIHDHVPSVPFTSVHAHCLSKAKWGFGGYVVGVGGELCISVQCKGWLHAFQFSAGQGPTLQQVAVRNTAALSQQRIPMLVSLRWVACRRPVVLIDTWMACPTWWL
jgi:hypothetical protein